MNQKLIENLKEIVKSKYNLDHIENKYEFAKTLIEDIGIEDSYIRDRLIYPVLAHTLHDDHLADNEMMEITKLLIDDEHLMHDMPNDFEYSVLRRSFVVLQLVIMIYKDRKKNYLSDELFQETYKRFINYFNYETDFRGYEDKVGWLHSIAHSADLFVQFMQSERLEERDIEEMFTVIQPRFMINSYVFVSDEDERMVTAIHEGLKRNLLSKEFVIGWIQGFQEFEKLAKFPEDYNVTINIRNFLRSLYFRLVGLEEFSYITDEIVNVSNAINHYKK